MSTQPVLLNPGPVVLSQRVKNALQKTDICHREHEFSVLQDKIRQMLTDIYRLHSDKWSSILLTGSGTAAVEAMLTSIVPKKGRLLVIENGAYGERMSKIAQCHGIDYVAISHEWGEDIDFDKIETLFSTQQNITHLAVVHHETSTGRLNNLTTLAKICNRYGIAMLLDAVSSFAAETIDFAEWPIVAASATSNKCIHGAAGVSFVIVQANALAQGTSRSLYLDLNNYLKYQNQQQTPFTPAIPIFYALAEALEELEEKGGWKRRQLLYQQRMQRVRVGLTNLGIKPFMPTQNFSCVLNTFYLPEGLTYQQLHAKLKASGFIIYAGQEKISESCFRISCMGEIAESDLNKLINEFGKISH